MTETKKRRLLALGMPYALMTNIDSYLMWKYRSIIPEDPGAPTITGTSYYVDSSTVGTEEGTIDNPFRTIDQANAQVLNPGDGILFKRGEVFYGQFECTHSGNATDDVFYSAYGEGERPIMTTSQDRPLTWNDIGGNIWESVEDVPEFFRLERNNVEIMATYGSAFGTLEPAMCEWQMNGTKLQVYNDPTSDTFQFSDEVYTFKFSNMSYIFIYGLDIRDGLDASAYGVALTHSTLSYLALSRMGAVGLRIENHYANPDTLDNTGVVLDSCIIDSGWELDYLNAGVGADSFRGAREGIMFSDTCVDYIITNNYFNNHCHSAVNMYDSHVTGGMQNIAILGNYFTSPILPYGGRIMLVGWDLKNHEIAYNRFENQHGSRIQTDGQYGHIHHNIWKNVKDSLIDDPGNEGVCLRMNAEHGAVHNNTIENNVHYDCQGGYDLGSGTTFAEGGGMELITVRNNIFYDVSTEAIYNSIPIRMFNGNNTEMNRLYTMQNNISFSNVNALFGSPMGGWNAGDRVEVAEFESVATSQGHTCSGNITADPLFVDAEAFMLGAGSPAIGVGLVPLATLDYNGNTIVQGSIGTGYDLGLYNQGSEPIVLNRTGMTDIKQGYTTGLLSDFRTKALAEYV